MNLLADECCDAPLVQALRNDGHDVLFALESMPGAPDTRLLQQAHREQRVLLTADKDFGELVYRLRYPVYGLVLLRFTSVNPSGMIERTRWLMDRHSSQLPGAFVVLDAEKARFRPLR